MRIRSLVFLLSLCAGVYSLDTYAQDDEQPSSSGSLYDALFSGQPRALLRYGGQRRNSNLHLLQDSSEPDVSDEKLQYYSAFGGLVGYETAPWNHITMGATAYVALPFGNNPDDRRGLGGLYEEDGGQDAYAALGEMFIRYQKNGHLVKIGRQEMPNYRMVSLSNVRFSPVTHSGAVYENTVFGGLGINLGYIMNMKERNETKFIGMARGARLQESSNGKPLIRGDYDVADYDPSGYIGDSKEMTMLGLTYSGGNYSLDAWNYYISDFVNSIYLEGQYHFNPSARGMRFSLAVQYTNQKDVGDHIGGNIDTWHYGLSFRGARDALGFFVNYNDLAYNEDSYDGGTLFVRWGTPQMFNSFQVQDSELAGTESVGAGLQYDFGHNGLLPGVVMRWRYAIYNLPDNLTMTDARQDRQEATFDLRYSFAQKSGFGIFTEMKGLSIQFRLAFNNYNTDYNFEAYREIHGYDFQSATEDFVDARLYLDYVF